MPESSSFDRLKPQLQAGDADAAWQVFERYAHRLIALARSRLEERLRQKVDPEDVVQSALRSFFCGVQQGHLELRDRNSLWSLLAMITARKCRRQARHFYGPEHDVRREAGAAAASNSVGHPVPEDEHPTPAEAALLADVVRQFHDRLTEPEQRVLELRLQGHSAAEMSATLGRSENSVNWLLKGVRKKLRAWEEEQRDE